MEERALALTAEEREAVVIAVQSVFAKLRNLYRDIEPMFTHYGFTAPSAGVVARDLSEKIEAAIVQHCAAFSKGSGHCDLSRAGQDWEVKICKGSGLTVNQSKQVAGENYIVVNYTSETKVTGVWVLWEARDEFFSARKPNTNARSLMMATAERHIEWLYRSAARRARAARLEAAMAESRATPARVTGPRRRRMAS